MSVSKINSIYCKVRALGSLTDTMNLSKYFCSREKESLSIHLVLESVL